MVYSSAGVLVPLRSSPVNKGINYGQIKNRRMLVKVSSNYQQKKFEYITTIGRQQTANRKPLTV
jgi:hypothetical protein